MLTPESRLSDAIRLWHKVHGHTLKDARYRFSRTLAIADAMGDPLISEFTARTFANYRADRAGKVSNSTLNHELRYLRAALNELVRLDFMESNPLVKVRQFKVSETELAYLDSFQIEALFTALRDSKNSSVYWVARICLNTGARWVESESLYKRHVQRGLNGLPDLS